MIRNTVFLAQKRQDVPLEAILCKNDCRCVPQPCTRVEQESDRDLLDANVRPLFDGSAEFPVPEPVEIVCQVWIREFCRD